MSKLIDPKLISISLAALSLLAVGAVPSSAIAGKVVFERSKPHVNACGGDDGGTTNGCQKMAWNNRSKVTRQWRWIGAKTQASSAANLLLASYRSAVPPEIPHGR